MLLPFLSHVQEFTGARPNYYKKYPAEANDRKQDMQARGGHGQASPCTQALCVTYCTIVTRVRFKVLAISGLSPCWANLELLF